MKNMHSRTLTHLRRTEKAICLVLLLLLMVQAGLAQSTSGSSIVGSVTDEAGAVIPKVSIRLIHQETGATRELVTNDDGQYSANILLLGNYVIEAEQSGFKKQVMSAVKLDVNQTIRADITMQAGNITEVVQVESQTPLIKTDRSDVGVVVDAQKIVDLPLNGRNFLQLASLAPGTVPVSVADGVMPGGVIANGASSNSQQITLDGVEDQDWLLPRVAVSPSPDSIAEFKIQTATYSAESGRASGANISVVTKSGTNAFHGGIFWFHRNDNFDARNFFDRGKLPEFKRNQYGFVFGGPIVKNKTFFFGSFEGLRERRGLTANTIVPTDAQRAGDFSGGPIIYDPLSTTVDPVTGRVTRTPFPENRIPANRISPQAMKALDLLFPRAQVQIANQPNAFFNPKQISDSDQVIVRIDHRFSDKANLWGRYAIQTPFSLSPTTFNPGFPGQGTQTDLKQQNLVLGFNYVFSPTVVNDARFGFNRYRQLSSAEVHDKDLVGEIGIEGALRDRLAWGPPNFNITGISQVGGFPFVPSAPTTNTFQYIDTLAITKDKHNFKMGADIRRLQQNGSQFPLGRGWYFFNGGFTSNPAAPAGTGQGVADFLLGNPSLTLIWLGRTDNDMRGLNGGFFFQDDWNISRNLTLNLGVRYNYMPHPVSAGDRIVNWSEEHQAIILAQNDLNHATACAGCNGRTVQQLTNDYRGIFNFMTRDQVGYPKGLAFNDNNNFEPRVGLAWRLFGSNDTVLRAGYGRFYEIVAGNIQWNMSNNPPYSAGLLQIASNTNALPVYTLRNPLPGAGAPPGFSITQGTYPRWRDPYQDNWNVTLEQRVFRNTSIQAAYVGSRGQGQPLAVDFNGPIFNPTFQSRPHPERGATGYDNVPWGHRWYDSMQAKVETRTNSISLLASYTWAHSLSVGGGGINENLKGTRFSWNFFGPRPLPSEPLSPDDKFLALDKGPSAADIRHRLSVAYVWQLPIGKGRQFDVRGPIDWIAGGWQLTGITVFQSGAPRDVGYTLNNLNGAGITRPNLTCDPNDGPKTINKWFNTSCFAAPIPIAEVIAKGLDPLLAAGNAGRGIIRGPGLQNWDLGIFKIFPVKEDIRIQFRAEMFNAFNHPNFGGPDTTFGSPTFGQIFSASTGRQIQLGLKLNF